MQLAVSQHKLQRLSLKRCLQADAAALLIFAVNNGKYLQHVDFGSLPVSLSVHVPDSYV